MKKKLILLALAVAASFCMAGTGASQSNEYRTIVISGTADVIIDSTLNKTYMDGKRLFINGIYWWYDNAANTNQIFVEVVSGSANMNTQGAGRQFKYSEAMTSSGIKGQAFTPNVTTAADSTIFLVINATASDSLYLAVNYRFVNK